MDRQTARSLLWDGVRVLAWLVVYVALIWRWAVDESGSIILPIVWSIYTLLSVVALVILAHDVQRRRRNSQTVEVEGSEASGQ